MNLEDDIFIKKFLRDELSKEDQNLFLQRVEAEPDFNEKYKMEKQLFHTLNDDDWNFEENKNSNKVNKYMDTIKSNAISNLKEQLKKENDIYKKTIQQKSKPWFIYAAVAAVVLLFIVFNFINFGNSPKELYASYLDKTELTSIITRSDNQDELSKAQILFENKEYKKALYIFNKELMNKENQTGSVYIYTGISQMELNQFEDAKNTFDTLLKSDLLDAEKGYWFKALLFLKANKMDECKKALNVISSSKWYNFQKANELLDKLK